MGYRVGDQVVLPAHGVGEIVDVGTKSFFGAEARSYYEVAIEQSTVWVPVDDTATGLRSLTSVRELARYRAVLASQPGLLTPDPRQRRLDLLGRLRAGSFMDLCELVRDLTGRSWVKSLSEADMAALRKARQGLCMEWAAATGVTVAEATAEVDGLLASSRS